MNKKEAITALADGNRLYHKSFGEFGWIVSYKGTSSHYMFAGGSVVQATAFWEDRRGEEWNKNWSIENSAFTGVT